MEVASKLRVWDLSSATTRRDGDEVCLGRRGLPGSWVRAQPQRQRSVFGHGSDRKHGRGPTTRSEWVSWSVVIRESVRFQWMGEEFETIRTSDQDPVISRETSFYTRTEVCIELQGGKVGLPRSMVLVPSRSRRKGT